MRYFNKFINGWKYFLGIFFTYITLVGFVSFPCFLIEESCQMITFSSWQSISANRWDTVMDATNKLESMNKDLIAINTYGGWIQPLLWISYDAYSESTTHYIKALRQRIFANDPQLLSGHYIEFEFMPKEYEWDELNQEHILRNRKVCIVVGLLGDKSILNMVEEMAASGHFYKFTVRGVVTATDSAAVIEL